MIIDFSWFKSQDVQNVISALLTILDIVRIVVPIGLIAMTTIDITKKVINPEDKDGQKKIMIRALSALIVFLSPIIVNLVLNFVGIDTSGLGSLNSKIKSKDTSPTYTPPADPVKLTSLSLFNCPNIMKAGDSVELKTNIPTSYKGSISWEETKDLLDIIPSYDKKSATISLLNDDKIASTTITVTADGLKAYCIVSANINFSITNCPPLSKRLQPGDRITLTTDVSSKYNGKILWDQDHNVFKMTPKEDGHSMVLEVVDNPPTTAVIVKAIKGNRESSCLMFVDKPKLDTLSVINCPNSSNIRFDPGEEITLTTDIPDTFKGDIVWKNSLHDDDNNIIITPSDDGRSATIRVIDNPTKTFATPMVVAGGKASSCVIYFYKSMIVSFDN